MYTKEEKRKIRIQFWDRFKQYTNQQGRKMSSWVLRNTQIRGVQLKFDLNDSGAFVMLQISNKRESQRYDIYERFYKYRVVINDICGDELIWSKDYFAPDFTTVSAVYFYLEDASIFRKEQWKTYYKFFFEKMSLLEEAFLEVKEVVEK